MFKIGTNHDDLDYIYNKFSTHRALPMPDPLADPIEYGRIEAMLDGSVRKLGWLRQTWHWQFMSKEQYTELQAYYGDVSIITLDNDGEYTEFTGYLVGPEREPERRSGRVLDVSVTIKKMVEVPE